MKRVFSHIGFSFALTLFVLNIIGFKWALASFIGAGVLFAVSIIFGRTRKAVAVPLCLFCIMLASMLFYTCDSSVKAEIKALDGKKADCCFYMVDLPCRTSNGNYLYIIKTKSINLPNAPQNIRLKLYSSENLGLEPYELMGGRMNFYSVADSGFDSYGSYADGIYINASLESLSVKNDYVNNPNRFMLEARENIQSLFEDEIGGDNAGIALSILTGDKSLLSYEAYNDAGNCGITHLLVVSGLHLAVLISFVSSILKRLSVRKEISSVILLLGIVLYSALSGFTPSVIRAGIMAGVLIAGEIVSEKADSLNSLGAAAFFICFNPYAVTDVSTLLTFSSVLGLITINPFISGIFRFKTRLMKYISGIFCASLSVMISTIPAMYLFFGNVNFLPLVLNIILIPLAQAILILSLMFLPFHFIAPLCTVLSKLITALTDLFLLIIGNGAKLSFLSVGINGKYSALAISAAFLVFSIAFFFRRRELFRLAAVLSVIVFSASLAVSAVSGYNCKCLYILSGRSSTAFILYDGEYAAAAGITEFEQYYKAKKIIERSGLKLMLVIDDDGNEYSARLAEQCKSVNYVSDMPYEHVGNYINFSSLSQFDVDLWQDVNVKYHYNEGSADIRLSVYSSSFYFTDESMSSADGNDMIYVISDDGYYMYGVNKWQE